MPLHKINNATKVAVVTTHQSNIYINFSSDWRQALCTHSQDSKVVISQQQKKKGDQKRGHEFCI